MRLRRQLEIVRGGATKPNLSAQLGPLEQFAYTPELAETSGMLLGAGCT